MRGEPVSDHESRWDPHRGTVDQAVIDGAINVGAFLTELTGDVGRFTTTGNVRNYALYFFLGVVVMFWWIVFG